MSQLSRKIEAENQVPFVMQWVQQAVSRALAGGPVQITLGRVSKSRDQEAKYHAMIEDIRSQCFKGYSREGMKAALINQFALEREQMGEPLRNPGEKVWDWKNEARVYVRPSSKKFTKREAADFIEFLYATGSEFDVQWSEKALAIYDEMREARAA
ncbi:MULTISPECIES: recombination protein NinB [unclassified Marinobacter]|uniref:recombination protein NinB n=1 Tax=unclassified Marinobacter TaxID=83889 RepID=UPI001928654A|nr:MULTISPECIES: recombination protein NinB [unclassified Marinobacter]MBL3825142.1 recombination protein NinB [Marinobacter sp. MC3]MBL3893654.1 recombination protein NinB [Marinobacter sp. MW3]